MPTILGIAENDFFAGKLVGCRFPAVHKSPLLFDLLDPPPSLGMVEHSTAGSISRMARPGSVSRLFMMATSALILALMEICLAQDEVKDPRDKCIMALISPEDSAWYDGNAPTVDVQLSDACPCSTTLDIHIRLSREQNRRLLDVAHPFPCFMLKDSEGASLILLDLDDGVWEGHVSVRALDLVTPITFHYVTNSHPQTKIDVLLPTPGFVYQPETEQSIVPYVYDESDPTSPMIGVYVQVSVDGMVIGKLRNAGRDMYIKLRSLEGKDHGLAEGRYDISLQVLDLFYRPRGEAATFQMTVAGAGGARGEAGGGTDGVQSVYPLRGTCGASPPEPCAACGERGKCLVDGGCLCDPDYVGDACEHSLLTHTHYLPRPMHRRSEGGACLHEARQSAATADMLAVLAKMQGGAWRGREVKEGARHSLALGHGLRWEALFVGDALVNQTAYRAGASWILFDYEGCEGEGLWCLLQPISGVPISETTPSSDVRVTHMTRVWPVPSEWEGLGLFGWSSAMMGAIANPRAHLAAKLGHAKAQMGFEHPIIGVHVRYGDGCIPYQMHRPPCEPIATYVKEVRALSDLYGISNVFVASDDAGAVKAIGEMPGIRALHLPLNRSVFDSGWWIDHRAQYGTVDRKSISESAMIDLLLLAECDVLVGTFSSHFTSAAFELSAFQKGRVPPYVSIDCPWRPARPLGDMRVLPDCQARVVSRSSSPWST